MHSFELVRSSMSALAILTHRMTTNCLAQHEKVRPNTRYSISKLADESGEEGL